MSRTPTASADECGAIAHSLKDKRSHSPDTRCDWCGKQGRQILDALVAKGLARRRRGGGQYVYVPAGKAPRPRPTGMLADDEPIPF